MTEHLVEYIEQNILLSIKKSTFSDKLAKITFVLFLFFIIFGTKLPFKERTSGIEDFETSNIINQIVFTTLFITAAISLLSKRKELFSVIFREKLMTLFLLWCLLSISWSQFSLVSFKRYFQILTAFTVIMSVLLHSDSAETLLKYMKILFGLYIIFSIMSIFATPLAKDENYAWRGLATSKNHLGQASVTAALIFLFSMKTAKWLEKSVLIFLMLISIVLLMGSSSSTSALTFVIILGIWFVLYIDEIFKKISAGRTFSIMIIIGGVLLLLSAIFLAPDLVKMLFSSIGEDETFTGRTDLWADILREIAKHPLLGAGYQGFWVFSNNDVLLLYNKYIWIPLQAHNGYLDIINEVGYIGFGIFLIMLISYFFHLSLLKKEEFWKWMVVSVLLINFQESTIFRPGIITGTFFIFAYLELFTQIYKQSVKESYV